MAWIGIWHNQYGSALEVTSEADGQIRGIFRTALPDSGFFGEVYPVSGVHEGDCIAFSFAGKTPHGDMVCSFTGLLREGRIQTMWYVASDSQGHEKRSWPHAIVANADTFERAASAD